MIEINEERDDDGEVIMKKIKPDMDQRFKSIEDVTNDNQYKIFLLSQKVDRQEKNMKEFFDIQQSFQTDQTTMAMTVKEVLSRQGSVNTKLEELGKRLQEDNKTTVQLFMDKLMKANDDGMNPNHTNLILNEVKDPLSGPGVGDQSDENVTTASVTNDTTDCKYENDVNPNTSLQM